MKKLHLLLIGLLLAGALALVGCSRYNPAQEGARNGRSGEVSERGLEQGRRGQAGRELEGGSGGPGRGGVVEGNDNLSAGRNGRAQEQTDSSFERLGRNAQPGTTAPAPSGIYAPEQSGRSVVETGSVKNLSGTLNSGGSEWYLLSGNDRYALHFGNSRYLELTGIPLREGESIEIRGFLTGDEVAVIAARLGTGVYAFRSEGGTPLWAGSGRGSGGGSGRGAGRGQGGSGQQSRPGFYQPLPNPYAPRDEP